MVQSLAGRNGARLAYCFLSELLGKKVYGEDYGLIGKVVDLIATPNDRYPEINGVILARNGSRRYFSVQSIDLSGLARSKRFIVVLDQSVEDSPPESYFLVRATLYDKQIVDIDGAKVERVNDVRILFRGGMVYLDSVDVGFTGLTRRLGWELGLRRLARSLFRKKLSDELIAWRLVQPFTEAASGPLRVCLRQEEIKQLHAGELADIFEELDRDERISLVHSISTQHAAEALNEADIDVQTAILRDLDTELAADILEEMEPAAAVDVIDKLPEAAQQSIMAAMEDDERTRLEPLVHAQANTAASLMTVNFLTCPETYTSSEALEFVRNNAEEIEFITYIHCMDDESHLTGVVSLRDLLLARPEGKLMELMHRRLAVVGREDDWETIANQFLKFRFKSLPVVDEDRRVLGIVTFKHSFDELLKYYYKQAD